ILEHVSGTTLLGESELGVTSTAVRLAVAELPLSISVYTDCLKAYLARVDPVTPTSADPLLPLEQPIDSLTATIDHKFMQELPAAELTAHPGHIDFPGSMDASAQPTTTNIEVNASYVGRASEYIYSNAGSPRWESTGLYVAAGEAISVEAPSEAVGVGIDLFVGSHSDTLWHLETIERLPAITRAWPIEDTTIQIASATGGLLYVRIPAGTDLGTLGLGVEGAYSAPMYVHQNTSLEDWQNVERLHKAPWAELVSDTLVLTLPSDSIRALDDPSALMDFWEAVQDANATLEGISTDRDRAERIVLDQQISAGWLHSGYPIMGYTSNAGDLTDLTHLETEGDWGPFHELGHNYQWSHWVLPGTTETTCNLFSVYVMEEVVGVDMGAGHSAISDAERQTRLQDYLDNGADFANDWSVWTALETYLQLQEAFGWEFYTSLFTTYRDDAIQANSDSERIETWIRLSSAASNRNLGPFYKAWGFPMSASLENELSAYPSWAEDPMAP
ncbi:MAG: M60 family metallopeptidase, partial [Myxococcota bacterium]|nr:M60 family metallopeptidase [Myxococcota bacterium]